MIHFDSYGKIADAILNDKDEVEVDGVIYSFSYRTEYEYNRVFTGVQFMGDEESYLEEIRHIKDVDFWGAFDKNGEMVETDFEIKRLTQLFS